MVVRASSGSGGGGSPFFDATNLKCVAFGNSGYYDIPVDENATYIFFNPNRSYTVGNNVDITADANFHTSYGILSFGTGGAYSLFGFAGHTATYNDSTKQLNCAYYGLNIGVFTKAQ